MKYTSMMMAMMAGMMTMPDIEKENRNIRSKSDDYKKDPLSKLKCNLYVYLLSHELITPIQFLSFKGYLECPMDMLPYDQLHKLNQMLKHHRPSDGHFVFQMEYSVKNEWCIVKTRALNLKNANRKLANKCVVLEDMLKT